MGRFKKRYSRQKNVYRAEDGFTRDTAFYEDEQEFEQPAPFNRGPKRRFTGRGLHYTAPANRSSHVLSFVAQGGTFRNVNMNTRNDKQTQKRDRNMPYFPQKKGEGRPNRTIKKQPRKDFILAPPKLKRAIQLMYKLLKLKHHMSRVSTKIEGNQPLTFKRLASLLTNNIRPAFPNETVTQMVKGSALNWAYTTQLILEQHYEDQVEVTLQEIKEETEQKDWAQAFEIASGWATKNYGAKMDEDIIERTEALITVELCEREQPALPQSPPREPGPSTSNIRSYAQVVASTPSVHHTVPPQITARPPPNQERKEEEPNHEVGPIQAHSADGANENAEPEPIQAQVEVTAAENTAMRPIQASGEFPPLGDHMVHD
ncbi:hypothetical protein DPX16_23901 [Anabarilius grahami]|uniref:Uncharacterized protein n=1 Tax=Anabarilius grahami TaxID=495550 RepID=A0A3N0YJI3_ANAGA|nr:hypothetical protein DPX16_23901 [Anabarilius grahami]